MGVPVQSCEQPGGCALREVRAGAEDGVRERSQAALREGSEPAVHSGAEAELHPGVKASVFDSLHAEVHTGSRPKVPPCAHNRVSETAQTGQVPSDPQEVLCTSSCQGACDCASAS